MAGINISQEDAILFERLLIANRDSAELQNYTEVSYQQSIKKLNSLGKKLGRF